MSRIYAINTTNASLTLKGGAIVIPRAGYKVVAKEDSDSADFLYAEDRGWLKLSDTEPGAITAAQVAVVEEFEPYKGLTSADLKAEQSSAEAGGSPDGAETGDGSPDGAETAGAEVRAEARSGRGRGRKAAE